MDILFLFLSIVIIICGLFILYTFKTDFKNAIVPITNPIDKKRTKRSGIAFLVQGTIMLVGRILLIMNVISNNHFAIFLIISGLLNVIINLSLHPLFLKFFTRS